MSDRTFGIQITADGKVAVTEADKVADSLDRVGDAQKRATDRSAALSAEIERLDAKLAAFTGKAVSLEQHQQNVNYATDKAARQFLQQGDAMALASKEVQRLLDRYDPLGTKLRALQSDFALLNKAAMGGEIGSGSDAAVDKTYRALNDEIAKTKALMVAAGAATDGSASSMGKLGLNSQYARRELMMLGREALTGDFSRMPQSFGSLIAHSNLLPVLLNPVALGILAIGAAAGVMAVAFAKGRQEMVEMNNALSTTSNFAGMTRGNMLSMAESVSKAGVLTVGTSKEIVTAIVASGRYSSENVGRLASLVENYAAVTDESVDKAMPKLIKMFEDPARASETLNQQYHHLSVAELERIKTLQATGQTQEAVTASINAFSDQLPKHHEQLSKINAIWIAIKKSASEGWAAMTSGTQSATLEQKLATAQAQLARLGGSHQAEGAQSPAVTQAQAAVAALQQALKGEKILADLRRTIDGIDERQIAAQKIIDQSATKRITLLQQELAQVVANGVAGENRDRRIYELRKQIADEQRALGAEGRALATGAIADATRLYEVQLKSSADEAAAQLKLGLITKQQHDDWLTWLDLASIARKKSDAQALLDLGGLDKLQRQSLTNQIALYGAMAKAREDKAINADKEGALRLTLLQSDADAKAVQATNDAQLKQLAGLDDQIAKLREHNAEIGKTKEQVDILKAAQLDQRIKEREYDAAETALQGSEGSPYYQRLVAEITKLKELQSLQGQSAILEANARFKKREAEDWGRLWGTVESTGKTVFAHLLGEGVHSMEAIGKAIKASVIDLLYQLTARKWFIQIGAGIETSIYGSAGGAAGSAAAGSALGSAASAGWAATGGQIIAGYQGASLAAGVAGPTTAGAGGFMGAGAALASIPGWGWAALAALAILGMSGGGGAPKREDMFGMRNASGDWWIGDNNITNHPGQAAYDAHAAFLKRIETTYGNEALNKLDLSKINISADPGTGYAAIWAEFQRQALELTKDLVPLTGQVKMTGDAAADAAAVLAIANSKRQMELQLMDLQGKTTEALAERRKDELAALDPSLRALQQQIHAAQDLATASEAAAKVQQELATIQRDRADVALQAMNDAGGAVWDAFDPVAEKLKGMSADFRDFSASITVSRNALMLSPGFGLSPQARYDEATRQAQDLLRRGQLGDLTAMQGFRDFASQFLDTSAAYNASGPGFQADKAWILSGFNSLQGVADRQASIAEEQLSEMQQTVEQLVGIRASTLSIEQAMAAFARAQGAFQGAATAAGGNLSKESAGALYDIESKARTQRLTSLNALYQNIFGREGDVQGLVYYANQMAAGKSLSRVEAEMLDMRAHGAHAEGLWRVPFDGYRAVTHADEMIAPAPLARVLRGDVNIGVAAGRGGDRELLTEIKGLNRRIDESRAENAKQTDRVTGAVDRAATANSADLRSLKQHLAHVLARKAA